MGLLWLLLPLNKILASSGPQAPVRELGEKGEGKEKGEREGEREKETTT